MNPSNKTTANSSQVPSSAEKGQNNKKRTREEAFGGDEDVTIRNIIVDLR